MLLRSFGWLRSAKRITLQCDVVKLRSFRITGITVLNTKQGAAIQRALTSATDILCEIMRRLPSIIDREAAALQLIIPGRAKSS